MNLADIKTIAVMGAGTMGNGIAHVFARAGYKVILRDVEQRFLDRGMETIAKNLDREIKKGKIAEAEKGSVLRRLQPVILLSRLCQRNWRSSGWCSGRSTEFYGRRLLLPATLRRFR